MPSSSLSKQLFIIDPLGSLNTRYDTTVKLAFCLSKLGKRVFIGLAGDLFLSSHPTCVSIHAQELVFQGSHYDFEIKDNGTMALKDFEMVHMRKEPPYDTHYLETLWLLTKARDQTLIINDPLALERFNEKLMIADFEQDSTPLFVSSDPVALYDFAQSVCLGDVVVKPLNLFGGRGVIRLQQKATMLDDLKRETEHGAVRRLVQKYEPRVVDGEVRAFTVCGQDIAWCLKVPASGNFLANTREGSTLAEYSPSKSEREVVVRVSKKLLDKGIYIAGFDIICGKISEINITCPALLGPDRESIVEVDRAAQALLELDVAMILKRLKTEDL
jgi:glutathione synthase